MRGGGGGGGGVGPRAPDNFLKQGVADASLEVEGVFLQNAEVFFTPKFYLSAFL